jgi:hypothetical protein
VILETARSMSRHWITFYMRSINHVLYLPLLVLLAGCAVAETDTEVPTAISEATVPVTLPAPTAIPPTVEKTPTLKAGQWTYIFYHEGLEQVLLVNGGPERGKPADDPLEIWSWNGTDWSLISAEAEGPTWRNWAAAAYDSARDVLVIHGGLQSQNRFDETWEWDGQRWTLFTGSGPGAREGAVMAYDAARASMILFGGATPDMQIRGDTWEWDGQAWRMVSEAGPAPRFPGGMVDDPVRKEVLMYSGHFAEPSGGAIDYDDLWSWDGTSWREVVVNGPTPDHRTHAGFVFDPVMGRVLLLGSGSDTFRSDIWAWDGTKWEEIPTSNTPARSGHTVAYDPTRDRFVLFGGVDRPGAKALDDTWEWDRQNWVCIDNC